MRPPIFVRALTDADTDTDAERTGLEAGLRASEAFVVRRCQIVLGSARGERVPRIAQGVGCDPRTVRDVAHGFNGRGLAILTHDSTRPPQPAHAAWTPQAATTLPALLHHSPRAFGHATSGWTLALVAEVSAAQGLSTRVVSDEAVRKLVRRLDIRWKRAKHWITRPDPAYAPKGDGVTA